MLVTSRAQGNNTEVSQSSEGLNIKLFQMLPWSYIQPCIKRNRERKVNKMIEQVINRRNMHLAYKHVLSNKGSAGVDGMQVSELKQSINRDREAIVSSIINGRYLPQTI